MFFQHRWECISPNIRMYFSKYMGMYFSKYKWGNLSLVSPWNIVFPSLANTKHLFHRKLGQRKFSKNVIFVHQPHTTSIDQIIIIITTRSLYYNALPVSYIMQHFPKALRSAYNVKYVKESEIRRHKVCKNWNGIETISHCRPIYVACMCMCYSVWQNSFL